jgi:hypothetical protein
MYNINIRSTIEVVYDEINFCGTPDISIVHPEDGYRSDRNM